MEVAGTGPWHEGSWYRLMSFGNLLRHGGRWYRPHGAKAVMEVAGTGPWHEGS